MAGGGEPQADRGASDLHFAPTDSAAANLRREGVGEGSILITGNTVIDALLQMVARLRNNSDLTASLADRLPRLDPGRRMILVTGHRRESFGGGFERICQALGTVAARFPDVEIVYPVHLNPSVHGRSTGCSPGSAISI